MIDDERLLRREEVEAMVGLSRAAIYAMMDRGEFPKPIRIGRKAVRWKLSELGTFIDSRQRGPKQAGAATR